MKTFKEYLLGNKTSYPKYAKITNMGQEDLKRIIKDKKSWESRYTWTDGYDDEQDVEELYKNFKRRGVFIKDGPRLYTAGLSFIGMTEFISGFSDLFHSFICLSLYHHHTVLISNVCNKFRNWKVSILQLCSSFSSLSRTVLLTCNIMLVSGLPHTEYYS